MTHLSTGDIVLTELDSEPHLLVTAAAEVGDDITGVLLADLAPETIQRFELSAGDRQRQNSRHCSVTQQKGGWQPGGNGVRHTCGGRHPRRQVPAPGQSMNWVWVGERLSEGRNPTNRYKTGIKNVCDSGLQSPDLTSTEGLPFCSREVGR